MILTEHPKKGTKLKNGYIVVKVEKKSKVRPSGNLDGKMKKINTYFLLLQNEEGTKRIAQYKPSTKTVESFEQTFSWTTQGTFYKTW